MPQNPNDNVMMLSGNMKSLSWLDPWLLEFFIYKKGDTCMKENKKNYSIPFPGPVGDVQTFSSWPQDCLPVVSPEDQLPPSWGLAMDG